LHFRELKYQRTFSHFNLLLRYSRLQLTVKT
jgi:hypothetical protein